MGTAVVTAGAVASDAQTIFAPGAVAFMGESLAWVGAAERLPGEFADAERLDLTGLVVVPAFVNAHTHLCLSGLRGAIPPSHFPTWVLGLLAWLWSHPDYDRLAATEAGIAECLATGTAAVGDVVSVGGMGDGVHVWDTATVLDRSPLAGVAYLEVLGLGPGATETARRRLAQGAPELAGGRLTLGLGPHAPYGTDEAIYRLCVDLARETGWPLMTHLAETREEEEFIRHGTGPLGAVASVGQPAGVRFMPPGCSPVEYVSRLGLLSPTTTLAHLNYPSERDIELVAGAGAHVAFCPGSHRYFGHDPHPVEALLDAGVNVALGTDSLASNESLSMLREVRLLRASHPAISAAQALAMATRNGALALGIADRYGALRPGMSASFVAVRPPDGAPATDPLDAALSEESSVEVVVIEGRRVA